MKGGTLEIDGARGRAARRRRWRRDGRHERRRLVIVRGDAGERAGDRLRRGTILVEGRAGAYAGSRMIAGTLSCREEGGALPGYLMKRGTIVLGLGARLSRRHSWIAALTSLWRCAAGRICSTLQQGGRDAAAATVAAACRRHGGSRQRRDIYRKSELAVCVI